MLALGVDYVAISYAKYAYLEKKMQNVGVGIANINHFRIIEIEPNLRAFSPLEKARASLKEIAMQGITMHMGP